MASTLRGFADANARFKPTIGDTKTSAVKNDHMGWLKCDGRNLNTSDYAHLFSAIKYSFGGSGSFFKLPNAVGRVPGFVGHPQDNNDRDEDGGVNIFSPYGTDHPLGDVSGEEVHQLTLGEMPKHNHDVSDLSGTTTSIQHNLLGFTDVSGEHDHGGFTVADGIHSHDISQNPHSHSILKITNDSGGGAIDDAGTNGGGMLSTLGANADITIQNSAAHTHPINPDGDHRHRIRRAGNDEVHNNIQPTIWIGNLFIYGGRPWAVATPQSRKLQGANPVPNSNYYPPQGPTINLY